MGWRWVARRLANENASVVTPPCISHAVAPALPPNPSSYTLRCRRPRAPARWPHIFTHPPSPLCLLAPWPLSSLTHPLAPPARPQILAFPCNQFGEQEPGSMDEIVQFVHSHYQVGRLGLLIEGLGCAGRGSE